MYDVERMTQFDNGVEHMVEVWGTCRTDGQFVRYVQPARFFALRVALYRRDHPGVARASALRAVASAALAQYRESWRGGE